MVLRNRLSDKRFRPIGWRGESYRHYLASKGIPTNRYTSNKYFAKNDYRKGNRDRPGDQYASIRKSLNAQGYNAELQEKLFNIPRPPKKSKALFDVPDRDEVGPAISQLTYAGGPAISAMGEELQDPVSYYESQENQMMASPSAQPLQQQEQQFTQEQSFAGTEEDEEVGVSEPAQNKVVTEGVPVDPTWRVDLE